MTTFDHDTGKAAQTLAKSRYHYMRGWFADDLPSNTDAIEDDKFIDLLWGRDPLIMKALADVIESGEFTADQLAEGIRNIVDAAQFEAWVEGKEWGEAIAKAETEAGE